MKGTQQEYNRLLDAFNANHHRYMECIDFLLKKGYSLTQARNALYVYKKDGKTLVETRRTEAEWNDILEKFNASGKGFSECVHFLMTKYGATYHQARGAVINYRR